MAGKLLSWFRDRINWAAAEGDWPDIVFSTRVRFARNLHGFPFPGRAARQSQAELRRRVLEAVKASRLFPRSREAALETLSPLEKRFLVERRHISHNLAAAAGAQAVVIASDETLSAMVNEEDHLRLQAILPGFSVEKCLELASSAETGLGAVLPYAYGSESGFLTACPTNTGTGLRVSCMVHLPALGRAGRLGPALESLSHLGVTARGMYGEGTYVLGDLYQISNSVCLGRSEEELAGSVRRVIRNLINFEIKAREDLLRPALRLKTEDAVHRARALLSGARLMSYEEFMQNASMARMGLAMGLRLGLDLDTLNQMTIQTQPAHLSARAGRELPPGRRDAARAEFVRSRLG
ncbi:MAG: ATP:guanido phosphotransferase [Elusimicrobia bacterium]|nr:MAG: ATP:guanido phosphotransferase [Elusimicrobiota bacterium]KAF0158154.1 MAG: ATP:guanido phosphotransferase [Elusimicrobiota bacterium]